MNFLNSKPKRKTLEYKTGGLILIFCFYLHGIALADSPTSPVTPEQIESSLRYQKGKITLKNNIATLQLPDDFRYLDIYDTILILVQLWHNPHRTKNTLGMIFPSNLSPIDHNTWGIIINYEEDGHVSEDDADKINYSDLLVKMKNDLSEASKGRQKLGYESMELIGWGENPSYDKKSHKLYWAQEYKFGNSQEHILNYNIRILGRKGVLVLNAIAGMGQFLEIKKEMLKVIAFTDFETGNRYVDFDPKIDKVAGYGLTALVTGEVAAKSGKFQGPGVLINAAKMFFILAIVGFAEVVRRLLKRKKSRIN